MWYPASTPVRRGTCYGVVDGVTIMRGHPAIYVTWMHAGGGKTYELVAASQISLARTTR